ncbi:hypothetical protein Hanom_Chr04g00335491 [Helianthus anomalus]
MDLKQLILLQHSPMFPPRFVCSSWSGCDNTLHQEVSLQRSRAVERFFKKLKMDEEFFNAFSTPVTPITFAQNTMLENETGTMQKPPKLMNIEEFKGWEGRFENWV